MINTLNLATKFNQQGNEFTMKKRLGVLLPILLLGCSGAGTSSSGNTSTANAQTYGGVSQPASYAWTFRNLDNSTSGMIRLTNSQSGIIFLYSDKSSMVFTLKGEISNFTLNQSQCLTQTPLTGSINDISSTASITLSNCVFNENQLTALVTLTANNQTIYSGNEVFGDIEVSSASAVATLSNSLANSDPILYNHNSNIIANLTTTLNGYKNLYGNYNISGGIIGKLFGNLTQALTTGTPLSFNLSSDVSSQITFTMIDSTSVNADLNLTTRGYSTQLKCNILLAGLVVENSLNENFNSFVTGCSGSIPSSDGTANTVNLSGNLDIK